MTSSNYPSPERPGDSKLPNQATVVRDEALLRLIAEMNRTWEERTEVILSKMDRIILAIELLAGTAERPVSSPSVGTSSRRRRESPGALEPSPGTLVREGARTYANRKKPDNRHPRADHGFLVLLRENYIQVLFGLAVGMAALLFALYLFARAR